MIIYIGYVYGWCQNRFIFVHLIKPIPAFIMTISKGEWSKRIYLSYMLGDISLMLTVDGLDFMMILGIICFMAGHLWYRSKENMQNRDLFLSFIIVALFVPDAGSSMRLIILVYFTMIVSIWIGMVRLYMLNFDCQKSKEIIGWSLFIFSDALIVKGMIKNDSSNCDIIMGSYWFALMMIW